MKNVYRSIVSCAVAFGLALLVTISVHAVWEIIDDSSPQFTGNNLWIAYGCSTSNAQCHNNNAKYRMSGDSASGRWNFGNKHVFEVWIPAPYANNEYGTVKYVMNNGGQVANKVVNQTNYKRNFVYLGYVSGNGSAYVYMHAGCVDGYPCGNSRPVIYDMVRSEQ